MYTDEINRYLLASIAHSITVDVRASDISGFVRKTTIHSDLRVTIEHELYTDYVDGVGEGGWLKYIGQYATLEEAVRDLEEYLGAPIAEWNNFTAEPFVSEGFAAPPSDPTAAFKNLLRTGAVVLPKRGNVRIADIYWRRIRDYGEFRMDEAVAESSLPSEAPDEPTDAKG